MCAPKRRGPSGSNGGIPTTACRSSVVKLQPNTRQTTRQRSHLRLTQAHALGHRIAVGVTDRGSPSIAGQGGGGLGGAGGGAPHEVTEHGSRRRQRVELFLFVRKLGSGIHDPYGLRYVLKDIHISAHLSVFRIAPGSTPALWVGSAKLYFVSVSCVRVKSRQNTDTEQKKRFVPQSLNTGAR